MSGPKRFIVLEVQAQAETIKQYIDYMALTYPETKVNPISLRQAETIVYYLVRDIADGRMAHKLSNPENVDLIQCILFGCSRGQLRQVHNEAYKAVTEHSLWHGVTHALESQLGRHIKRDTWTDWVVILNTNLVALVEGEDHRITEYHKVEKAIDMLAEVGEEAVLTVNCSNPINYLHNQFNARYGNNITTLQDMVQNPLVEMDMYFRKMASGFFQDAQTLIAGIFCEGLVRVNPQIELSPSCPTTTPGILKLLGIYDIESFYTNVVSKLIIAFGMGRLGHAIKRDQSYTLEFYKDTGVIAIFDKKFNTLTERNEEELLHALIRGDYLPYDERIIAEKLYIDRPNMVLSLSL